MTRAAQSARNNSMAVPREPSVRPVGLLVDTVPFETVETVKRPSSCTASCTRAGASSSSPVTLPTTHTWPQGTMANTWVLGGAKHTRYVTMHSFTANVSGISILVDIYRYKFVRRLNNRKVVTDSQKAFFGVTVLKIPYLCW